MNFMSLILSYLGFIKHRDKDIMKVDIDKNDNEIQKVNGNPVTLWLILVGIFLLFLTICVAIAVYLF